MNTPLADVNSKFESKDKLVDQIVTLLAKDSDESKDDMRKRLLGVANKKLLRLHGIATTVKEKFGSREKLVTAAATAQGRGKDTSYIESLDDLSLPTLVSIEKSASRSAKAAPAAAKKTASAAAKKTAPAAAKKAAPARAKKA